MPSYSGTFRGLFLVAGKTHLNRVGTRGIGTFDAAAALRQETFVLGPIEWIEIDSSGSAPETLMRASAVLGPRDG